MCNEVLGVLCGGINFGGVWGCTVEQMFRVGVVLLLECIYGRIVCMISVVQGRVSILARLRVIEPLFFLWTHKLQLKLTITCPLGRARIHNGGKIPHGKSLTMSHFCSNYQNIELNALN